MTDERLERAQQVRQALDSLQKRAERLREEIKKPLFSYSLDSGELSLMIPRSAALKFFRAELRRVEADIKELQKEWQEL